MVKYVWNELSYSLCTNNYSVCDYMKNIESYADHLVFLDSHHDTIHLVR